MRVNFITLLSWIIIGACASQPASQVVRLTAFDADTRRAFDGTVTELHQFRVKLAEDGERDILIIRNPSSGAYWWLPLRVEDAARIGAAIDEFPGPEARIAVGSDAIGFFMVAGSLGLYVRSSRARASSIALAEQDVMRSVARDVGHAVDVDHAFRIVSLAAIGSDLVATSGSSFVPPVKLLSASRSGRQWLIKVAGPKSGFADVALDDDFRVRSVKRYQ